jgi:hypothetical protein
MKRESSGGKSQFSDGVIRRAPRIIDAIELVFRRTHRREMTSKERRLFQLPPAKTAKRPSDPQ